MKMLLPRAWLLLQVLSPCPSFAFATTAPISAVSDPRSTARHRDLGRRRSMCREDPQQPHYGPLHAFPYGKQRGQYPPSYQKGSKERTQPRHFDGIPPLSMIPTPRISNITTPGYYRSTSLLEATKRGGGKGDGDTLTAPTSASTSDEESSLSSQVSSLTQPLTDRIGTIGKNIAASKTAQGRAILLLVAFLYGTLNVTLRGVYATEGPPVASVLSLVRQCLSIVTFIPLFIADRGQEQEEEEDWEGLEAQTMNSSDRDGEGKVRPMWMSALELAFWNFGAQGLINAGLLFSPAARASFLTQTSVVMTPLISALAGESIKSSVWGGCGLALAGLYLISTSANTADLDVDAASSVFNQGDAMILLGALSWSTYIFRTSKLAKAYRELDLQFAKTYLLAFMYFGWFLTTAASTLASAGTSFFASGWLEALKPLWPGWTSPVVWLLLAYSAVGPGAVADILQQKGQQETSASESNIILTMESVFAALCAFALLGEVSSFQEISGGMLIVVAAILASR